MTEEFKKYELTIDFIMILGKYFKENKDFINIMKVTKKYQELVQMYHFNPISDTSLFENMQTQHFYTENDINNKKNGLYQYIYWVAVNADEILDYLVKYKYNDTKEKRKYHSICIDSNTNKNDIDFIQNECKNIKIKEFEFKNNFCDISKFPNINNIVLKNLSSDSKYHIVYTRKNISITLPEGITTIENISFGCCKQLTNIILPKSLKEINNNFFSSTGITTINIPEGVTRIGNNCFSNCKQLTNVILPSSLIELGNCVFRNTSITSIIIPEGLTKIGYNCFEYCKQLTNVILPTSLKEISKYAFYKSSITEILIPEGITKIGNGCFDNCSELTNIKLPASLIEIDDRAFSYTNITTITIPEGVTKIENGCFYHCDNLKSIILPSSPKYDIFCVFDTNIKKLFTYEQNNN